MTQHTIKQILSEARALIDQPEKWTQNTLGRDATGKPVDLCSNVEAAALCASGAILAACMYDGVFCAEETAVRDQLMRAINGPDARGYGLAFWNDEPERTHAEVMQAFDRAIEDATS